jgi:hypothetical protein
MRAAATDWRRSDVAVIAASAVGLAVVSLLLLEEGGSAATTADALGTIVERQGFVRRRPAATLVWDDAGRGERLGHGESVFVGPDSSAALVLDDGARLEIHASSLVVLERPGRVGEPPTLALRRGSISAVAAGAAVKIRGARGDASLAPGARARVVAHERLRVQLVAGDATVGGESTLVEAPRIALSAPAQDERLYFSGTPAAIVLRWDGAMADGFTLEVARDPDFQAMVAALPAERGDYTWVPPTAGAYFWRLVDARRVPGSEVRKLVIVADAPPLPFAPAEGEVVLAPAGRSVPFWWTEVDDVPRYLLEISSSPRFDSVAFSAEADGPGAWIDPRLPEGTYHWRVRSVAPGRGPSPPSLPSAFRIVHSSVPDAPELLGPSIQVDDAPR